MIHASASASTPTFSFVKQLTMMATTSAPSESHGEVTFSSREQRPQQDGGMHGGVAGEVADLMPARGAGGDDGVSRAFGRGRPGSSLRSPICARDVDSVRARSRTSRPCRSSRRRDRRPSRRGSATAALLAGASSPIDF